MEEYINKKLGELLIHQFLQQLSLNEILWDFDPVSLCPSRYPVMIRVFIQEGKLVMLLDQI